MKLDTSVFLFVPIIILLTSLRDSVNGKRILIVAPTPMYSHQMTYRSLWRELYKRGHELVIVTPFRIEDPILKNYTEILFDAACKELDKIYFQDVGSKITTEESKIKVFNLCNYLTEKLLQLPEFKKIYVPESKEKFDLVIVETLFSPVFYLLGQRFDAPLIGITSLQLHNSERYLIGSPIMPSHLSNWELDGITENPTFWKRLNNFIATWYSLYDWLYNFLPAQESIARKYLGENSDIVAAGKSMSLLLANSHALTLYARPDVPTVVYYSCGHITNKPPPLPTDLKEFLDNATNGFVYVSLGTTVRQQFLSKRIKTLFVNVLSKLPWSIVWKRDDLNDTQKLSFNQNKIYVSNWLPQQGILAHPNIKLFIYQGGLHSTEEAMAYGVPLLGIPILFDQEYNVKKIVSLGLGKHLPLVELTETNFYNAIFEIITDKSYKEKILELRSLLKDLPYNPVKNAIWWIEYVIRTKGAPHLQYYDKNKPLYQQYNVDVIAFLVMAKILILVLLLCLTLAFSWYAIKRCQLIYVTLEKEKKKTQ